MRFQRFLVPVYYWKTVEIVITDVNYFGKGSSTHVYSIYMNLESMYSFQILEFLLTQIRTKTQTQTKIYLCFC
jgi:hypothetical protein